MSEKNVLGEELLTCSYDPLTGYFRDGSCAVHDQDGVAHLVCVQVTSFIAHRRPSVCAPPPRPPRSPSARHFPNSCARD